MKQAQFNDRELQKAMQEIIEQNPDTLRAAVAQEALDYEDIYGFFKDLLSHGCSSGMVGSLISYRDTHAFYDKHYDEIEELRQEYEDSTGESLQIKDDLKNFLAWFGFEETAYRMANELDLEI